MSTLEWSSDWLARIGDRANPILVKETRQALKSRQFVATFMLLLAASWFLFVIGVLLGGDAIEYGAIGAQFFQFFYWILAVAVMVVVPFGAYRSLLAEKDQATYDLLSITTLSPRQIVWGKLLSALVQVLIFYSAIAPFIAFTSLLQGFDFVAVAFKLIATMLLSMLVTMGAIASSAMTKLRPWQALSSMMMFGMLFVAMSMLLGPVELLVAGFDLFTVEAWWTLGLALLIAASYFLLFQQVAVAHLTFASDDRASGIRLICSGQFFLLWGGLFLTQLFGPSTFTLDSELIFVATIFSALHWGVMGLIAVTEDPYLSRRIRRNLPADAFRRLLWAPFLQGGHRGYLCVLIHLGLLGAFSLGALWLVGGSGADDFDVALAMTCYVTIYLGLACALGRWCFGLSGDIRPGHVRVLTLIIVAIGSILPFVSLLWADSSGIDRYSLLSVTSPIATLIQLADTGGHSVEILTVLVGAACVAVVCNIPAMKQGIAEVVSGSRALADATSLMMELLNFAGDSNRARSRPDLTEQQE
jgi:hypothetical protein